MVNKQRGAHKAKFELVCPFVCSVLGRNMFSHGAAHMQKLQMYIHAKCMNNIIKMKFSTTL